MPYPILAKSNTWWAPTVSTVTRSIITEIEIMDSYTPDSSITVVDSWDASAEKDGSITCYVVGTKLIIAGNGTGKIYLNTNANNAFGGNSSDSVAFLNVTTFNTNGLLDTSRCTSMYAMFARMKKIETIDLRGFDTLNVTVMFCMFESCHNLVEIKNLSLFDTSKVTMLGSMFSFCRKLTNLDVSNFDTKSCTNIGQMFNECNELEYVDTSNWDTSLCTSFKSMFNNCSKLKNLNTTNWNTSSCTDMSFMFYQCSSLGEIDVSNWDVSKVTNFDHFAAHANLKRKGIENWKTASATNMNAMFHNCAEEELDLSGFDVSKNQFFCQMFENSPNLKRVKGLNKWNTSSGLGFDGMFERCYKLEEVDLSSFNTAKAKNNVTASTNDHKTATLKNMFLSCNNLKKVIIGPNFSINGDGTNTTASNKLILPTPSSSYIAGADGNWYIISGDSYAPNTIPDKTPNAYYASFDIVANLDVIVKNGSLIDAARAIREKSGDTGRYRPGEFGAKIRSL